METATGERFSFVKLKKEGESKWILTGAWPKAKLGCSINSGIEIPDGDWKKFILKKGALK